MWINNRKYCIQRGSGLHSKKVMPYLTTSAKSDKDSIHMMYKISKSDKDSIHIMYKICKSDKDSIHTMYKIALLFPLHQLL